MLLIINFILNACNIRFLIFILLLSFKKYLLSPTIGFPKLINCFLSWCFLPVIGFNSTNEYLSLDFNTFILQTAF